VAEGIVAGGEEGVAADLLEGEIGEADTGEADDILTHSPVHDVLLGGRAIAGGTDEPELISTVATVEVVGAGAIEDVDDVVIGTTEDAVAAAADVEDIKACVTAEAVASEFRGGVERVVAGATGDHIVGIGKGGVITGAVKMVFFWPPAISESAMSSPAPRKTCP